MNFVRRSLGAVALTFCGMLSLHADVNQIVQPVRDVVVNADNLSQSVTNFKNALKQVLANTIQASLIDQENIKRCNVGNSDVITGKAKELIDASKDANQVITGAGFDTVEIIEVKEALAQFNNAFGDQKVRGLIRKLPKLEDNHDSVVNYMNAVKATVAQKDLITVLNIAKKCNGADAAALLKLRDELKVGKDAAKIAGTINPKNVNAYIAKFSKQMAKIATMTAAQANNAHSNTLAQARIVARAAREAGLADVNHDAFDAQIVQVKADLKARFVVANQEIVDRQAAALVKKAQPGLMSKVGNGLTTVGYHLTVTPAKGAWWAVSTSLKGAYNFCISGKKGGNEVVNHGVFAPVITAINELTFNDGDDVVQYFAWLTQQAEIARQAIIDTELNEQGLKAVVMLIDQKYKACLATVQDVRNYVNDINILNDAKDALKNSLVRIRFIFDIDNDVKNKYSEALRNDAEFNASIALFKAYNQASR